ncbi:cytochrome P460 family protein [Methylobacterium oxalidis]|uniref:cytochrome P460 family protein n=1 Tax=Methylobacterium oxalidis TaxID=944322 RepID=UPI003315AE43
MNLAYFRSSAIAAATCFLPLTSNSVGGSDDEISPIFGVGIPAGYRDWRMISVAHEAGDLNDLRAVLGNDIAIKAFREGTRPFPDGTVIARLAWKHVPSQENNAAFGREQSFIPGVSTNLQISVKDAKKYIETGGWGYGQFEGGKANRSEALMKTCFPCHTRTKPTDDFVFTHYAQ